MIVLANARLVTPHGILDPGWVAVRDTQIVGVGQGEPPSSGAVFDLGGCWVLPGFIDLHMHGGGGHDVATSRSAMAAAVAFHHAHGTTRTLVSLVTAPVADLQQQLGWVADLADVADETRRGPWPGGRVVGAHLEGPFLAPARCGAQPARHLLDPDPAVFDSLLRAARGTLRCVTVAPELPGALSLIADIQRAGAIAAVGHTDATYEQAAAAFAAGAGLATHLFNGMRPVHHREPGAVLAALDAAVPCEVINDGVHLHPAVTRLVATTTRAVLVTDAMAAAGRPDGDYLLGGQEVRVTGGQARLRASGALAGSTLTMDDAVRRAVQQVGLSIEQAAAAAATTPAALLGLAATCGAIAPGLDGDLVVLDGDLRLSRVMAGGQWTQGSG